MLHWPIMRRHILVLVVLGSTVLLGGCLFTVNHPLVTSEGTMAVFLDRDGGYALFPEEGVLHLFADDTWTAVALATLEGGGGLLDLSPDEDEALYVDVVSEGFLDPMRSVIHRVALEPDAVPERVWETDRPLAKVVWHDERRVLLLTFGEYGLAELVELDLETGTIAPLAGDLLSFAALPDTDDLILLEGDRDASVPMGSVIRWNRATGRGEVMATFVVSEATIEAFGVFPHAFLWDVAPDGAWVALCLYDGTLIEPAVETDLPSLYLIDTTTGMAQRTSSAALMPAFAPEGTGWVYVVDAGDGTAVAMWDDLDSDHTTRIPGTEGVSTVFWLSPSRIGLTFEVDDDEHRWVELDLTTERMRELIGIPREGDE